MWLQASFFLCLPSLSLFPEKSRTCFSETVGLFQLLSLVWLFATPCAAAYQASLSITDSWSLLKFMFILMPSNHLILCHPFSSCLPSFPASGFFLISWFFASVAKVLELQLRHQSFQWIFRTDFLWIDWLDLLAVQGTLKSLLQHHSSKASVLQRSAFFIVQLSHMTTGKTIALTIWTFVGKVMSLLFIVGLVVRAKNSVLPLFWGVNSEEWGTWQDLLFS